MTETELKIRQLTNQYLITPADKQTVLRDLNGVQAQFMSNALHSMKIRCTDYSPETAADGAVKNWTIRGTVHVFAESDLPLFKHCDNGRTYRRNEWHSCHNRFTGEVMLTPERQKYLSDVILAFLAEGIRTASSLPDSTSSCSVIRKRKACIFRRNISGRSLTSRGLSIRQFSFAARSPDAGRRKTAA